MKADFASYDVEHFIVPLEREGIPNVPSVTLSRYSRDWNSPPLHRHRGQLELCFCQRGALGFRCNGRGYRLLPNNIFVSQPSDLHHLFTNCKGMVAYWILFRYPRAGETVLGLPERDSRALVSALRGIRNHAFAADPEIRTLFPRLFSFLRNEPAGPLRTLTVRSIVLRILVLTAESAKNRPTISAFAKISRLAELLKRNPTKRYRLAELAAQANLSEGRFTALFREITGLPPHAYMNDCRLKEVGRRLLAGDEPISMLAGEFGFASARHLATQFRSVFGKTPTAFRARQRAPGYCLRVVPGS